MRKSAVQKYQHVCEIELKERPHATEHEPETHLDESDSEAQAEDGLDIDDSSSDNDDPDLNKESMFERAYSLPYTPENVRLMEEKSTQFLRSLEGDADKIPPRNSLDEVFQNFLSTMKEHAAKNPEACERISKMYQLLKNKETPHAVEIFLGSALQEAQSTSASFFDYRKKKTDTEFTVALREFVKKNLPDNTTLSQLENFFTVAIMTTVMGLTKR